MLNFVDRKRRLWVYVQLCNLVYEVSNLLGNTNKINCATNWFINWVTSWEHWGLSPKKLSFLAGSPCASVASISNTIGAGAWLPSYKHWWRAEWLWYFVIKDSQLVRGQRYFDLYSKYSAINKLRPQNQRLHTVL